MLSWQGLVIMFMFGVFMTITIGGMVLMYSEWKLERARKEVDKEILKKLFGGDDNNGGL